MKTLVIVRHADEHAGDEDALGDAGVIVGDGLEALAGLFGEAVQVQAVVPVRPADQRQAVRAAVIDDVVEGAAQVLAERGGQGRIVVKVDLLIQNRPVAGFLDVGVDGEDQPQGVVVEAGADAHVAALGERLVLVIGAAVRELGGGDVQDAGAGPVRDQVDEAQQVLAAVAEAHAAADAGLKVGGRSAHVEGDHALVLVPDIDLAVELFVVRPDREVGQQAQPVFFELLQAGIKLLRLFKLGE